MIDSVYRNMVPPFDGYAWEGLECLTNGFSEDSFVADFQFGKIYRGTSYSDWDRLIKVRDKDVVDGCQFWLEDKQARWRDEYCMAYDDRLQVHPNMIKIDGICCSDFRPAMVYELNALDTLHNLIDKDNFSWLHRVKAALGIASLLKCMHGCRPLPYLVRNISTEHIIVDQDYNAKIFDFSMISGGILADKTELLNQHLQGCYGYIDPDFVCRGKWSEKCDVFAFGVVLIGLISKKVLLEKNIKTSHEPFLYEWAHTEYQKKSPGSKSVFSLANKSFEVEPFFYARDGVVLTKLAMQCVDDNPKKRPTMKQIVNGLWELFIVRNHADLLSLGSIKDVLTLAISEPHQSIFKNPKVSLNLRAKALKTLLMYRTSKDNLALDGKGLEYLPPIRLSYEDIKSYTNGLCEENFINIYKFGKLYHGNIDTLKVTVKTWEDGCTHCIEPDNKIRLREELILLQHPKFVSHPHIVKLIGYCYDDEKLSAVYNLQSLDSLYNLISEDKFTWHKRIVFILELAKLLKYLQQENPPYSPYVLQNIFPNDILVDKDYMPKLFNFGQLLGGIMNDKEKYRIQPVHEWEYYTDPYTNCHEYYTDVSDIYSLGMVILNVITKTCHIDSDSDIEFDEWVRNEFESAKSKGRQHIRRLSLVNSQLTREVEFNHGDGRRVTKLGMQCIHRDFWKRPTINQVVKRLNSLKIMREASIIS